MNGKLLELVLVNGKAMILMKRRGGLDLSRGLMCATAAASFARPNRSEVEKSVSPSPGQFSDSDEIECSTI